MASLKDKDRPEQNRFLAPGGPELDGNSVSKLDGDSGEEQTVLTEDLDDLFVGGTLVTSVEKGLGVTKGDRSARRKIYETIDENFYDGQELDSDLYQALEAAVVTGPEESLRNIAHEYTGLSTHELVDYAEELDQAGLVEYQDASMESKTMGEFAYTFIDELESLR